MKTEKTPLVAFGFLQPPGQRGLTLLFFLATVFLLSSCFDDIEQGPIAAVPVNAAVNVAFTDLDPDGGQIQGAPTFAPAVVESDVSEYRLYWGQNVTTKLDGNSAVIATVPVGGENRSPPSRPTPRCPRGPATFWFSPPTPTAR